MPYVAPIAIVGGEGGTAFGFDVAQHGAVLKKLDVWVGPTQVRCISVLMTDGAQKRYGTPGVAGDKMLSFTFEDGDLFSSLILWPNSAGDHLGAIQFKTRKGKTFEAVMLSGGLPSITPTPVDVGTGMCFGVQGRSGAEVDQFGFMFIKVS